LTGGEPLLYEHYFEIASYARDREIAVLLLTNGTLITKQIARQLMDLRIFPCVKLDSLSAETQDYLAGAKGSYAKIMNGLKNLIEVGYTTTHPVLSVNEGKKYNPITNKTTTNG
jgi:MoaA/NifB/PqqE/SkfB family radical SAM enzyme